MNFTGGGGGGLTFLGELLVKGHQLLCYRWVESRSVNGVEIC